MFRKDEKDADETQFERAIQQEQLSKFVSKQQNGLDTILGERGVKISGGQRQRIAIARALYYDLDILVLDDATSALDNDTEVAVIEAINALQGQKTLIIVVHRLTTIEKCDKSSRLRWKSCSDKIKQAYGRKLFVKRFNEMIKRKDTDILVIGILAFMSLIIWGHGETFFANPGDTSVDTAVFQTVGYMMKRGFLPYVNTFDHKGPLLYLIHYLGSLINTNTGVGIFQLINYYVTFLFAYKIARFKLNRVESVFTLLVGSIILLNNHKEVADVEEFSMGFICVSLYIFLNYLIRNKTSYKKIFIAGFCCGAVFMIKMNQVSCWIVFSIYIFIELIRNRDYKELKRFTAMFIAGFLSIVLLLVIWLLCKGCLSAAISDYIVFNFKYIQARREILTSIEYWLNYEYYLFTMLVMILVLNKDRRVNGVYIAYMFTSYCFIAFMEDTSCHHGLILIPAVIYPIACLLDSLNNNGELKRILIITILAYIIIPLWFKEAKPIPYKLLHARENSLSDELNEICSLIKENTDYNDKISVYGNWDVVYLFSDRVHATKYSFQNPIRFCDDKILPEYIEGLRNERPKIIVLQGDGWGNYDGEIKDFLDTEDYDLIYQAYREAGNGPMVFMANR